MKKEDLINKKNVVLIISGKKVIAGLTTNRDAIRVGVVKKVPLAQLKKKDQIPKIVEDMETDVFETPEIHAFETKAMDRTSRIRPVIGGVSGGHPKVTAGTINPIKINGIVYILSNNHVLANSNDASIGDQTWQPGSYDGGSSKDVVGNLSKFVPIHFESDESTCPIAQWVINRINSVLAKTKHCTRLRTISVEMNTVDCAISHPIIDSAVSEEILEIGIPTGFAEAIIGETIKKSGRTSGLNSGIVEDINGIARVNYGTKTAVFTDQIITTAIASPGDSGSVVLNENNEVIGLLFGGSDQITIVNKIQNIIVALKI